MSDLTRCCFCSLESMRDRASARGTKVVVKREVSGEMSGWTSARYADKKEPSAWFMRLTKRCVC